MRNNPRRNRFQERITCNIDVVIDDSIACTALNISEGGVYLHTSHSFSPGSVVKASLNIKNKKIEVTSRVKYCNEGIGVGLMFIDMNDTLKKELRKFIEHVSSTI